MTAGTSRTAGATVIPERGKNNRLTCTSPADAKKDNTRTHTRLITRTLVIRHVKWSISAFNIVLRAFDKRVIVTRGGPFDNIRRSAEGKFEKNVKHNLAIKYGTEKAGWGGKNKKIVNIGLNNDLRVNCQEGKIVGRGERRTRDKGRTKNFYRLYIFQSTFVSDQGGQVS